MNEEHNAAPPTLISDAHVIAETPRPGFESVHAADAALPPRRAGVWLLRRSPLHWISLGMGSGLSPVAPGTVGTLWAWAAFLLLDPMLSDALGEAGWGWVLLVGFFVGWWACTRTAQAMRVGDPGAVVWDEVLAFWLILWLVTPASFGVQLAAFLIFRLFDAAKPGPVGWADRRYKGQPGTLPGWRQGFGIIFDDLVAALCTLLVMALWHA